MLRRKRVEYFAFELVTLLGGVSDRAVAEVAEEPSKPAEQMDALS